MSLALTLSHEPAVPSQCRSGTAQHVDRVHCVCWVARYGERRQQRSAQPVELVFDPSGAVRVTHLMPDEEDRRTFFWMNEHSPTFLLADPPAKQGEPRFAVELGIDGNKRLLITARDLQTGRVTHRDYPVIKLT